MRANCCLSASRVILVGSLVFSSCISSGTPDLDWRVYLGDPASSQYSRLDQINRENVSRLQPAWIFRSGDTSDENRSQIQCNPIVVDGVLFGTTPRLKAFALNAATGEALWMFDPFADSERGPQGVSRGVAFWEDAQDQRVFYCAGSYLYSLDAKTGAPDRAFGTEGRVDLRQGLGGETGDLFVGSSTPGVVYRDLLIWGTRVGEGPGPSAPGHIRAFNARTGEIAWIFHTIPHPGEFGYETWPEDAWKRAGGANAWTGLALDEQRGIVYVPTGSPAFDFWGGDRQGQNLFGNCLLALRADNGERIWHYQFVHHDLWDRDLPAPPNLVTVTQDGRPIPAVAQVTKSGHVFMFHRDTGELLFPVEERPVPPSDLKGEKVWPTQPFPLQPPSFARQAFTEEDLTDLSPEARASVIDRFRSARTGRAFIPPSTQGTLIFPGFDGGAEWGGAAWDQETGLLYINSNEMPWILEMVDVSAPEGGKPSPGQRTYSTSCAVCHGANLEGDSQNTHPPLRDLDQKYDEGSLAELIENGKGSMPSFDYFEGRELRSLVAFLLDREQGEVPSWARAPSGIPYSHTGYNRFLDHQGYPAVKPPWGTLNAIDLDRGEIRWQVPLGEFPELTEKGIAQTGTENYGGPVVTAGGLVFIAASKDEKFRAFDKETGRVLWETRLPAGGYATPCTYSVEGKQYVVIAAGGGKMGTRSGDSYLAFSLPDY